MAIAMAMASSLVSTRSSFCGDCEVRGFVRKGEVSLGTTADRSTYCSFYALRVRCGKKKEKNLAGKLGKVQELVKMQRELVLLSSTEHRGLGPLGDLQPEDSIQIAVFNINVLNRTIKSLEDLQAEVNLLNVKAKKKKFGLTFSSSCSKNSVNSVNSVGIVPLDLFPSAMEPMNSLIVPPFHSAAQKEESAIVAQIRALCSTAKSAARKIHSGELKNTTTTHPHAQSYVQNHERSSVCANVHPKCMPIHPRTPGGRVITDATSSSSLPSSFIMPREISTSGTIEVCTGGKCKRRGSQQILAALQGCTTTSSSVSVTSCKCMGKCKTAPNVRVKDSQGQTHLHSHVSMDDSSALLEMHFGVQASADESFAANTILVN